MSKATGVEGISRATVKRKERQNGNQQDIHIWVRCDVAQKAQLDILRGTSWIKMFMDARKALREGCFRVK